MSSMSRKDFELIAETIANFEPPFSERNQTTSEDEEQTLDTRRALAEHFAEALRHTNPYFDSYKFIRVATGE